MGGATGPPGAAALYVVVERKAVLTWSGSKMSDSWTFYTQSRLFWQSPGVMQWLPVRELDLTDNVQTRARSYFVGVQSVRFEKTGGLEGPTLMHMW
jgi:hypothetical protein